MVKLKTFVAVLIFFQVLNVSCSHSNATVKAKQDVYSEIKEEEILTGATRIAEYLPMLKGKRAGAVVNHTSLAGQTHLVDTLISLGVDVRKIFSPEHGFRGIAPDGEKINDGIDPNTSLPLISLYGSKRKPGPEDLEGLDVLIFDIQDVGTRFYTYLSTMCMVMEACAENGKAFIVLDRPNPNGHFVDGPVTEPAFRSFVGLHEVPVVHGMTVGEYARMANAEGWLANGVKCDLTVVPCSGYTHKSIYELPVKPSPNLPNMKAVYLYPSLCFFEGTVVSVGRGTDKQFQIIGAPGYPKGDFTFTPKSNESSKYPPQEGKECRGYDLSGLSLDVLKGKSQIDLGYLLEFYSNFPNKEEFFLKTLYIDKLSGSNKLREQIMDGKSEAEIRETWQEGLAKFKSIRKKYLLYPDFE